VVCDGKIIAAAEEERFRRIKHWAGFPIHGIFDVFASRAGSSRTGAKQANQPVSVS
jgi:predicted NodU family carbamoyl transferase